MNLVEIKGSDFGIEEAKASELKKGLLTILEERSILVDAYKDVLLLEITGENLETFKTLRLQIRDNRTKGIEVWHRTNKAYFLAGGRFIDAIKNKEIIENERMEKKLMEAEKHFENLEKERIQELQNKRVELLSKFVDDAADRDLSSMDEDVWESYLATKKKNHLDLLETERKAEQERQDKIKAEKAEQERIKKENEKLKKEAEESERLAKIEDEKRAKKEQELKAKQDAELKERDEEQKKEREAYENKLKIQREESERLEREETAKRQELEAELKAKQDAEQKAKDDAEAKIQSDLNKGDSAKVKDLISDLEELKTKYTFKSVKNKKRYADMSILIDKVVIHINK